jgi:hypothetical protein
MTRYNPPAGTNTHSIALYIYDSETNMVIETDPGMVATGFWEFDSE